jgi:ATP-dependent Clp protease protease subunit
LRVVSLSGPLDDQAGNQIGIELMTLDATGDGPVHLQIDSDGGTLGAALALMDIIDVLGVPVRATGVGRVIGPAIGVLAVSSHRSVASHARLRFAEPSVELRGSARDLQLLASAHADQWRAFCTRVSEASGRSLPQVLDAADRAGYMTAQEAVDYGLADEVVTPDAPNYRLSGRPLGFAPR